MHCFTAKTQFSLQKTFQKAGQTSYYMYHNNWLFSATNG